MLNKTTHGGARQNSGPAKGFGRYGEPTKPVRVPVSYIPGVKNMLDNIADFHLRLKSGGLEIMEPVDNPKNLERPLFFSPVPAEFPSPADDYVERQLDLNEYFVEHPAATFYLRVTGDSMSGSGIYSGDIVIVDRSLNPVSGKIVIAVVNNELTVKRLYRNGKTIELRPENPDYPVISFSDDMELVIWGVVAGVVRKF
ncbi:MAG: translesion error-prone DNA polymerase V autoproteolytic subunit [Cyclobacteriaceae bacterium]|nr:translesion error-prone DNA polymerase V autoproteolytic subunit [Cyclobacteriaceae bacterium]